jgi:hypothetical protein
MLIRIVATLNKQPLKAAATPVTRGSRIGVRQGTFSWLTG